MHGLRDAVVPVTNGKALYESLTKAQRAYGGGDDGKNDSDSNRHYRSVSYEPMWIPGVGHNDMPELDCMQNIRKFLNFLKEREKRRQ
jgi:hypothetical protein